MNNSRLTRPACTFAINGHGSMAKATLTLISLLLGAFRIAHCDSNARVSDYPIRGCEHQRRLRKGDKCTTTSDLAEKLGREPLAWQNGKYRGATHGDIAGRSWDIECPFRAPLATQNKDLRRFERTSPKWQLLENKDLRQQELAGRANVPKNVPALYLELCSIWRIYAGIGCDVKTVTSSDNACLFDDEE